jgi:hypothetical protein
MLKRFGETGDSDEANWVAWTCALGPEGVKEWDGAVHLAEMAVRGGGPQSTFYCSTLGAVLYRAGRFPEAVRRLDEASAAFAQAGTQPLRSSPAYTWFFLALAHQRLGHREVGRQWLAKALKQVEQETRDGSLRWNIRLTLQLLRREAEGLLGPKAEQTRHQDTKGTEKKP